MLTLYLKVLFRLRPIRLSLMAIGTWLATNLFAAVSYFLAKLVGIEFDPFLCNECNNTLSIVLLFGLAFSAPSTLLLPFIYILIEGKKLRAERITIAIALIVLVCSIVIGTFLITFGTDGFSYFTVLTFLLPYVAGAAISFLLITKRTVFHGEALQSKYYRGRS